MDLKIYSSNNFFSLKGVLHKDNVHEFQDVFSDIFDKLSAITVSIENIEWMDQQGVKAFSKLYNDAIFKNKKLSIVGFGCEDLYEHFRTSEMTPNNVIRTSEMTPNNVNPDEAAA